MIRPEVMQHFVDMFDAAGFRASAFLPSYGLAEATLAVSIMPVGEGIVTDLVDERVLSGEGYAGVGRAPATARRATARSSTAAGRCRA